MQYGVKIICCHLLLLLCVLQLAAQRPVFLRVYNMDGKKLGRGFIFKTTDSSIMLCRRPTGNMYKEIPASSISIIKSKHSVAGRIGIASLKVIGYASVVGIVIVAAVIAANNPEYFSRQNNTGTNNEKHPPRERYGISQKKYIVNGNTGNWQAVKEQLSPLW